VGQSNLMTKRIIAIFFILAGATIAWSILGGTLLVRTNASDDAQVAQLGTLWGPEQSQCAPTFSYLTTYLSKGIVQTLPLDASHIAVDLNLEPRQKGLLWYDTYGVNFSGAYRVVNTSRANWLTFNLNLPADGAVYDDLAVSVDGRRVASTTSGSVVRANFYVPHNRAADVTVIYKSQGMSRWSYQFGQGTNAVHDFALTMQTNFRSIDFPAATLAPTSERQSSGGWELAWNYRTLVSGDGIGMVMPEPLQPGPLAQRITFWAPLSLLFYFFVLFILTTIRRIDLHPMNYFFLGAAFFAFHLLFAYTVDRISIGLAFTLCSVVSMFLTVTYLRLVVGLRFAAVEAALAQFFYLILFSLALFNEGFSGLAITIGSILTLFVTMQVTARIDWGAVGAK
jgi:inner membrane protein CreD